MLGEGNFIKRLMEFDKDNISDRVLRTLRRIIDDTAFTPDQVRGASRVQGRGGGAEEESGVSSHFHQHFPLGGQAEQGCHVHVPVGTSHGHVRARGEDCGAQAADAEGGAGGGGGGGLGRGLGEGQV